MKDKKLVLYTRKKQNLFVLPLILSEKIMIVMTK